MIQHRASTVARLSVVLLSLSAWAADMAVPGVPNFHHVNAHIYRGGQPANQGWNNLARLGVKTVIDLRPENEHSIRAEQQAVEAAGMHYINVPLNGLAAPPDNQVAKVLGLLQPDAEPVFVHCRRGADRTGTVIACYRIAHDGWRNGKALEEAKSYGMSWIEVGMQRYVMGFQPSRIHPPAGETHPATATQD